MTLAELDALSDTEIAVHASGGYGAGQRNDLMAAIRHAIARARAAGPVEVSLERAFPVGDGAVQRSRE